MSRNGDIDHGNGGSTRVASKSRAPLGVRIALIAAVVVFAAVACAAAVNLAAVSTFNAATRNLNTNIETAKGDAVDYDKLDALQEQTDAQFDEADAMRPLLLGQIRDAIDANRQTSHALTAYVREQLEQQRSGTGDNASDSTDQNNSSDDKQGGGLTEEQRQQVEDLLKSNQQSTPPQNSDSSDSSDSSDTQQEGQTGGTQAPKPW